MKKDRVTGIILALVALLFLYMTSMLPKSKFSTVVGAGVFPNIAAGGLLICAVALIAKRDRPDGSDRKRKPFLSAEGWLRVLKLTVLLAAFPFTFNYLGFLVAAFALLALMIRMFDMERTVPVPKLLLIAAVLTGTVYFMFVVVFKTQLPHGELFDLVRG